MDISILNNNPFAKPINGVQSVNKFQPISKISAGNSNPFAKEPAYVGLGIKDGAIQTSAAQLGKPAMEMRQIGIA